jgi:hypothetical protein
MMPPPTDYEVLLRQAFGELGHQVITDQVFCFKCGQHYSIHGLTSRPERCYLCTSKWDKGDVAYPDIMLEWYRWDEIHGVMTKWEGAVRVDGYDLHNRSRKAINHDYHQVQDLLNLGIRVFIVYNFEVEDKEKRKEVAKKIMLLMMADKKTYEEYTKSKEFTERVRKI